MVQGRRLEWFNGEVRGGGSKAESARRVFRRRSQLDEWVYLTRGQRLVGGDGSLAGCVGLGFRNVFACGLVQKGCVIICSNPEYDLCVILNFRLGFFCSRFSLTL